MNHALGILAIGVLLPATALPQSVPAVPPPRLHRIAPRTPQELQALFRPSDRPLPFVSAHRGGAAAGFPENCIATFERTLASTFAILEIDPRMTKDGAIVVHHDPTLERTTTGTGRVADRTLSELKALRLKDPAGRVTEHTIPTLDEVLEWARGRTVLVLDQKDVSVEARVRMIEKHRAESYAMLIVGTFKDARACHALNTNIMMEVMIPDTRKAAEFAGTGIPWRNVVAFVGHTPPDDPDLYAMIHSHGACCMVGTSRNLDRKIETSSAEAAAQLAIEYRALFRRGADILEVDRPIDVARMLFGPSGPDAAGRPSLRIE
jgi:glycerophosphoryl diester phosphodiesterase